ncbi:GNAT family N-acetyltransferase [Sunxiuqinia indica]|uniref:GNAT family N-acetyltransferase n=1 Tax=Sunxiuqinia indica TaxID=2692584 RepID=UPI0013582928|nr:GNAT family N-acetyltransferase [Sunxiuqinia indica]
MNLSFVIVDLSKELHQKQLIRLLDSYMRDEMGNNAPMPEELAPKILDGLKNYSGYLGFFALIDGEFVALANCNQNFSTFKAKPLINIHDFVVHPDCRGKGVGKFLLDAIADYGKDNGFCRVNLEVRHDNEKAQRLYQKVGFNECQPPMYFLERLV